MRSDNADFPPAGRREKAASTKGSTDGRSGRGKAIRSLRTVSAGECTKATIWKRARGWPLAATLAGRAFSNSAWRWYTPSNTQVGGAVHCSHGLRNGRMLPMHAFQLPARPREFDEIARLHRRGSPSA